MAVMEEMSRYRDFGVDDLLGADDVGPPDLLELLAEIPEEFGPDSVIVEAVVSEEPIDDESVHVHEDPFSGPESDRWVASSVQAQLKAQRRLRKIHGESKTKRHRMEPKSKGGVPTREIEVYDEERSEDVIKVEQIPLAERTQPYAKNMGAAITSKEREEAERVLRTHTTFSRPDDGWKGSGRRARRDVSESTEKQPQVNKRDQILAEILDEEAVAVKVVQPIVFSKPYHFEETIEPGFEDQVLNRGEAEALFGKDLLVASHDLAPTLALADVPLTLAETALYAAAMGIEVPDERGRMTISPVLARSGVQIVDVRSELYRQIV